MLVRAVESEEGGWGGGGGVGKGEACTEQSKMENLSGCADLAFGTSTLKGERGQGP